MTAGHAELLAAALAYAGRGWPVFPCEPSGKRPAGALVSHGLKDASVDPDRVRAWWARLPTANVGLAAGAVSGLLVLDLDGEPGRRSLGALIARHGPSPAGPVVQTGGGGLHFYFLAPASRVGNSAGRLGAGLDVRGDGGYVVAPPSVHASGRRYRWRVDPEQATLPALPGWLAALLAPAGAPARPVLGPMPRCFVARVGTPYGKAALRRILDELAAAPVGTRNHELNRAAFAVGALAAGRELDAEAAAEALAHVARAIGLEQSEITRTLRSGLTAGIAHPRRASERSTAR